QLPVDRDGALEQPARLLQAAPAAERHRELVEQPGLAAPIADRPDAVEGGPVVGGRLPEPPLLPREPPDQRAREGLAREILGLVRASERALGVLPSGGRRPLVSPEPRPREQRPDLEPREPELARHRQGRLRVALRRGE